ncbi:hypothetical protein J27TS7_54130 [Paenibacillus dendritiformis]|nr:hypothetical protein J27TS7_54130 [Paenibacillus dendritiformis]
MTDKIFWELISNSRKQGGKQVEWLIVELSKKPVNEIIDFEIELANKLQQSYTSSLWGAAFVSWEDVPMMALITSEVG